MKKSEAFESLEMLFESTFDDAVAYIAGKTGTFENSEKILSKSYYEMLKYFLGVKETDANEVQNVFINILNDCIGEYCNNTPESYRPAKISECTVESLKKLLDTDFDITNRQLTDSDTYRALQDYIKNKPTAVRKVYCLYFGCGYEPKRIAYLLQTDEKEVLSILHTLLTEIRQVFLKNIPVSSEETNLQ